MAGRALPDARALGRIGRADRRFLESVTLQEVIDGIPVAKQAVRASRQPVEAAPRIGERMSRVRTYLDWNATAPLRREARAAMLAALDIVGNPSSPHAEGRRARAVVEDAREQVAPARWAPSRLRSSSPAGVRKATIRCWLPAGRRSWLPASSMTPCWQPVAIPARDGSRYPSTPTVWSAATVWFR